VPLDLRPEDFRRLWPHALQAMLSQAGSLEHRLREVSERLQCQVEQTVTLLGQLPKISHAVETGVQHSCSMQIAAIKEAMRDEVALATRLLKRIEQGIEQVDARNIELMEKRRLLNRDKLELQRLQTNLVHRTSELDELRRNFDEMSTWERITARHEWDWSRLEFVPKRD
jgi:DNA repair exonuclease SbcCD ATPase subunit